MKTVDEWYQKFATSKRNGYDILDLIKDVRAEAFERAELEAYRSDENLKELLTENPGRYVAERIAKVHKEIK